MNDDDLIESLLPAVEQQLESRDTPYVKETFTRLKCAPNNPHESSVPRPTPSNR